MFSTALHFSSRNQKIPTTATTKPNENLNTTGRGSYLCLLPSVRPTIPSSSGTAALLTSGLGYNSPTPFFPPPCRLRVRVCLQSSGQGERETLSGSFCVQKPSSPSCAPQLCLPPCVYCSCVRSCLLGYCVVCWASLAGLISGVQCVLVSMCMFLCVHI